jgi:hypothetical protein
MVVAVADPEMSKRGGGAQEKKKGGGTPEITEKKSGILGLRF